LPLERDIAVDALAPAIGAIADESAIATWPVAALATRAAEPAAAPAAAKSATASTAKSAGALRTGASGSARNATGLAFDARTRQPTGSLHPKYWASEPEIILASLQTVA
jgi:hypothetical protein